MTEWITKILELAKVPTKLVVSICIASGILLFLPKNWQEKIYLHIFTENYGVYLGATFILTLSILFSEAIIWFFKKIRIQRAESKAQTEVILALTDLDQKELAILREFFIQGQNTLQLPVSHPVVAGLIQKGILEQVGSLGEQSLIGPLFSLSISEFVKPVVTLETVGLHDREPSQKEIDWVRKNRPEFVRELERRKSLYYDF
jgi:hypothetical protein